MDLESFPENLIDWNITHIQRYLTIAINHYPINIDYTRINYFTDNISKYKELNSKYIINNNGLHNDIIKMLDRWDNNTKLFVINTFDELINHKNEIRFHLEMKYIFIPKLKYLDKLNRIIINYLQEYRNILNDSNNGIYFVIQKYCNQHYWDDLLNDLRLNFNSKPKSERFNVFFIGYVKSLKFNNHLVNNIISIKNIINKVIVHYYCEFNYEHFIEVRYHTNHNIIDFYKNNYEKTDSLENIVTNYKNVKFNGKECLRCLAYYSLMQKKMTSRPTLQFYNTYAKKHHKLYEIGYPSNINVLRVHSSQHFSLYYTVDELINVYSCAGCKFFIEYTVREYNYYRTGSFSKNITITPLGKRIRKKRIKPEQYINNIACKNCKINEPNNMVSLNDVSNSIGHWSSSETLKYCINCQIFDNTIHKNTPARIRYRYWDIDSFDFLSKNNFDSIHEQERLNNSMHPFY